MKYLVSLLIVQPWFTAHGHPAQSTINTARILENKLDVTYVIAQKAGSNGFQNMVENLRAIAPVETFQVPSDSIRIGTIAALWHLAKMSLRDKRSAYLLFLDVHLVVFASLWIFFYRIIKPERVSLLYLQGPERVHKYFLVRKILSGLLKRNEIKLFLRTNELEKSWCAYFTDVPQEKIDVLPSLELPVSMHVPEPLLPISKLRLGVIGQIRQGKGLEWLIPLFLKHPHLGLLTVAGTFYDQKHRNALPELSRYPYFRNQFLSEDEIIKIASEQDYLLLLYENWDDRMEVATLYLAARANRPVIVYENGWCGRMVKTYGCGVVAPYGQEERISFFENLPKNGTPSYNKLISGLEKFRRAHSGDVLCDMFIKKVLNIEENNVSGTFNIA